MQHIDCHHVFRQTDPCAVNEQSLAAVANALARHRHQFVLVLSVRLHVQQPPPWARIMAILTPEMQWRNLVEVVARGARDTSRGAIRLIPGPGTWTGQQGCSGAWVGAGDTMQAHSMVVHHGLIIITVDITPFQADICPLPPGCCHGLR